MSELYELSTPVERADRSELQYIDLSAPVGRGIDLAVLCNNFSGFIRKTQMDASMYMASKMGDMLKSEEIKDAVQDAKEAKEAEVELDQNAKQKAEQFCDTATMADDEFIGKAIMRFDAIYKKDKTILKSDDKPISDFDYRELSFKDRGLIAVAFALSFMQS